MSAVEHPFDKDYWEQHWATGPGSDSGSGSGSGFRPGPEPVAAAQPGSAARSDLPANPYLVREVAGLTPGTALDAGCGAGAEAVWLAARGWRVTAADISAQALARAAGRAACAAPETTGRLEWVEADLAVWSPDRDFDLVTTHYAHPSIPQLDFYERIADWVAPGGTLLIVGHRQAGGHEHGHGHGHGHGQGQGHGHGPAHGDGPSAHGDDHDRPPPQATVTAAGIAARFADPAWEVVTAHEPSRRVTGPGGREITLDDVVVRVVRRPAAA